MGKESFWMRVQGALRTILREVWRRQPIKIHVQRRHPPYPAELDRYSYQRDFFDFDIRPSARVLDIGSGMYPLPYAAVLVDKYLEPTKHRTTPLFTDGKEIVFADIHNLPFSDKDFDFEYCSHLLEHVDDPIRACSELMRVRHRGFIETPAFPKDILLSWAEGIHKWQVTTAGSNLIFIEYTPRQLKVIRPTIWSQIFSPFSTLYGRHFMIIKMCSTQCFDGVNASMFSFFDKMGLRTHQIMNKNARS